MIRRFVWLLVLVLALNALARVALDLPAAFRQGPYEAILLSCALLALFVAAVVYAVRGLRG